MNGSGSSAPDGDPLTYQWQQTAGTPLIALSNANTATASFTAPNQDTTLTFQLTVSDGRGGTAADTAVVTVKTSVVVKPILYIANFGPPGNVTAYDITVPTTLNGNIPPNANLAGAQTALSQPIDLAIATNGALVVGNYRPQGTSASVTTYANALDLGAINGNIVPAGNVQGAATLLVNPTSLAIDAAHDLAFVSEQAGGTIHVYAGVSTADFNGNLAPVRTITSPDINAPQGIRLGANDELYVASANTNTVPVFASASTLNGTVNASRVITSPAFADLIDVFIDHNDTLYVVNSISGGNKINVFSNAATRNGVSMPDATLTVPGAVVLTAIAVDSAGNGYIVDQGAQAVYAYDKVATRNGTISPDRTLKGADTLLNNPYRAFVHE